MNLTIFKKEINQFFSSLVGYIAIIIFLVFTGLISFVFPNSSVLSQGFANLNVYFELAPLLFLFLIPAITMRLFSEEFNKGGKMSLFENTGVMIGGNVSTSKTTAIYTGKKVTLRDILVPEKEVPETS